MASCERLSALRDDSSRAGRAASSCHEPGSEERASVEFFAEKSPVAPVLSSAAVSLVDRSEEHTSELQSLRHLVCRLLLEKKRSHGGHAVTLESHLRPRFEIGDAEIFSELKPQIAYETAFFRAIHMPPLALCRPSIIQNS